MKLKTKLIVAFFSIICIPIIVVLIAVSILGSYHLRSIEKDEAFSYSLFADSTIQIFNMAASEMKSEIASLVADEPDSFLDEKYIEDINKELSYNFSCIAVEREDKLYYNGLGESQTEAVELLFNEIEVMIDNSNNVGLVTKIDDNTCLVNGWNVEFGDGVKGRIILVSFIGMLLPGIKVVLTELAAAIILIMISVALLMMVWIYGTILRRLNELKKAANEIKKGNLDYELKVTGADEIGELCQDFEEMRHKLKDTAEESVRSETESKELISNISHDLKTPITAIKGYVEGIMDGVASSPEKLDKYIRTIYVKANDMDKLIDELTIYSKIDTNRIPYTFSKIDISNYFDDCINELGIELESKGIMLNFSNFLEGSVVVIADSEQLKRVINNIISNSVKYMDKSKGIINVRLRDVGDYVQIEIEDNGKGIAARDMPYIFDRFYRADSSRNSAQGGSGIGLAIVKKIIEDHGGNIWASSKEGVGTVMYFVLRKHQEVVYEQNFDN